MPKLTITIKLGNAAFTEAPSGYEVARILREYADICDEKGEPPEQKLFDANGNSVGRASIQ